MPTCLNFERYFCMSCCRHDERDMLMPPVKLPRQPEEQSTAVDRLASLQFTSAIGQSHPTGGTAFAATVLGCRSKVFFRLTQRHREEAWRAYSFDRPLLYLVSVISRLCRSVSSVLILAIDRLLPGQHHPYPLVEDSSPSPVTAHHTITANASHTWSSNPGHQIGSSLIKLKYP